MFSIFVYFCPFLITISKIQIGKSIDGVLGILTRGRRMVGADETTELWQPPDCNLIVRLANSVLKINTKEVFELATLIFHNMLHLPQQLNFFLYVSTSL